jgi:hypothetical protein
VDKSEYNANELLEITIPFSAPYQISHPGFERCYGEIEISGTHYTYVKRRFYNDSLTLLCLPNKERTAIVNAENGFYKLVNGLHSGSTEKSPGKTKGSLCKNILAEFLAPESKWGSSGIILQTSTAYPQGKVPVYHSYKVHLPEIPPECYVSSVFC